ncbi:MAG: ATP-binding protein [Caulobacteraceae bacterium]
MRPSSLVGRLVWLAAGWSLAVLFATGLALSAIFQQAAISRFDLGLTDVADALYAGSTVDQTGEVLAPALTDARALRAFSGKYWEIAEPGPKGWRPIARSRSLWDSELAPPPASIGQPRPGAAIFYEASGPADEPLRVTAMTAQLPNRKAPVVFMAAEDRTPVDQAIHRFAATIAAALVTLAVLLVGAVVIQVRVGLAPLFAMGREVGDVRKGKAQRVGGDYPKELAPLAGELNALLDHNQEVVERQRTHVGNLVHALKTPVSVMLAEAERQPGPLADVVAGQAQAMRDHVEHHLRRARAAARAQGAGERTSVAEVLEELTLTLETIFHDKDIAIDWRAPDDLAFLGERQDFLEIAGNVLENACKWSKGLVRAYAEPDADGQRFRLTVEDNGPGLPPDRREEVLKRGARLDEVTPGSGLGLSIVDELARAYGGALSLSQSSLGGLKIEIVLPRAEV